VSSIEARLVNNSPLQLLQMMVVKHHGWRVVLPLLLLSTVVGEMVEVMVEDQAMAGCDNHTQVQHLEDRSKSYDATCMVELSICCDQ